MSDEESLISPAILLSFCPSTSLPPNLLNPPHFFAIFSCFFLHNFRFLRKICALFFRENIAISREIFNFKESRLFSMIFNIFKFRFCLENLKKLKIQHLHFQQVQIFQSNSSNLDFSNIKI